jgi:hypothetical protein
MVNSSNTIPGRFTLAFLLLLPCLAKAGDTTCKFYPRAELARLVEAHGGIEPWQALQSLTVDRAHQFAGRDQALGFRIEGDYPAHRLYLEWDEPPGQVAWDGDRAWSANWALAPVFLPRFVTTIGFTLVNLPWLALQNADIATPQGCHDGLPGHESKRFHVVSLVYEPEPSRKPTWFEGARNRYDLYIGVEDGRLAAVMQHWTYAGQLDVWRLPPDSEELLQLVVFETWVEAGKLLWPSRYSAYAATGDLAATGVFGPYRLNAPFDASRLVPPLGAVPDTSSSWMRDAGFKGP